VNCFATLNLKVVGNLGYRCNNSSPRYSVRTTMLSLYPFENFLRFQAQDEHNTSFFSNISWKELPQSICKITKKPQ